MLCDEAPPGTVDVGNRKQLFLDGHFADVADGVTLTVNPPQKTGEKLLVADQPWETSIGAFATVLQDDDGLVKMWYEVEEYNRDISYLCYATSRDGIHWQKPILGLHEDLNGSRENNIVMVGTPHAKKNRLVGGTVFKDSRAGRDRRYKFVWLVQGAHSPDGIHWTRYPQSLFSGIAGDTAPVAFWDDRLDRYVAYSRTNIWLQCDPEESKNYTQAVRVEGDQILRRHVVRAESDDFENWGIFEIVLAPGEEGEERGYDFYNSGALKYPWAEDAYFLHTSRYYYEPNSLDVQLGLSRDGIHWHCPSPEPFLPRGGDDAFDARGIYVLTGIVRMGDTLSIYYAGENVGHGNEYASAIKAGGQGYVISRAQIRLDGYTSMDAGPDGGTLITPPLVFSGSGLTLNVKTGPEGSVKVELCDPLALDAQGLSENIYGESEPITGDSVAAVVEWKDSMRLGKLAGKPVLLKFSMRDAKLYAFQFAEDGI